MLVNTLHAHNVTKACRVPANLPSTYTSPPIGIILGGGGGSRKLCVANIFCYLVVGSLELGHSPPLQIHPHPANCGSPDTYYACPPFSPN